MRFFKYTITIIFFIIVTFALTFYLRMSGILDSIQAPETTKTKKINVAQGTEDLEIDRETGMVFIGADNRLKRISMPLGKDGIYAFHIDSPTKVHLVSNNKLQDFHPHGISLWSGKQQKKLFVVNHKSTGEHTVEIFDIVGTSTLVHEQTIAFTEMYSPNDVHAVGPNSFYATNDRSFSDSDTNKKLSLLGMPFATAVYYDGNEGHVVASGLSYANGINGSIDGKKIYIAESVPKTITEYSRNITTGDLTAKRTFKLNSAPDNIDVDDQDILWVAGHENLFKYIGFIKNGTLSPSHLLSLNPKNGKMTDVFYDNGQNISGATTGIAYKNKLLLSGVHENFIIIVDR